MKKLSVLMLGMMLALSLSAMSCQKKEEAPKPAETQAPASAPAPETEQAPAPEKEKAAAEQKEAPAKKATGGY